MKFKVGDTVRSLNLKNTVGKVVAIVENIYPCIVYIPGIESAWNGKGHNAPAGIPPGSWRQRPEDLIKVCDKCHRGDCVTL